MEEVMDKKVMEEDIEEVTGDHQREDSLYISWWLVITRERTVCTSPGDWWSVARVITAVLDCGSLLSALHIHLMSAEGNIQQYDNKLSFLPIY